MKISKFLVGAFAALLLVNISCSNNDDVEVVTYNGIFISNEGGFPSPSASVDFISSDLNTFKSDIYTASNNEILGGVLQGIYFWGNNAFLVLNNSNKIVVADKYTFKKTAEITSNLEYPRYIAFSGNQFYVTNNNFTVGTYKLNVYKTDNTFVKSINFDRYAEKVVEAGGNIVVQTDGYLYDFASGENVTTGHTITIVKPSTNEIDNVVTLPDSGIISDLVSYQGFAYALSSTDTDSYIYKINPADGTFTTIDTNIPSVQKLRIDSGNFYFIDASNKVYSENISSGTATNLLTATGSYIYGFDVIDGKIFVSDASFTGNSTVYVYNASNGSLIKTFSSGTGTNGFYKN